MAKEIDLRKTRYYQSFIGSAYEKMAVANREVLLCWAISPLVIKTPGNIDKAVNIKASHVLYETRKYDRLYDCYTKLIDGEKAPPIDVDEYQVNHLRYYIPNDGNHRAAAAMMQNKTRMKAVIRGVVDLSDAPFIIKDRQMWVLVEDKKYERASDIPLNDLEFAVAETFRYMQTYDHMRRKADAA